MTTGPLSPRYLGAPPLVLALAGIFMGCILDAMIKHLGASYSAILIAFGRYAFGTLFSGAAVLALNKKLPDGTGLRRHAIRAVASTASAVLFFHALTVLPIAEATVLIFVAPLMIAPLARWLLKEKLQRVAVVALAIGFAGVLVTVQGESAATVEGARRIEGILAGIGAASLYALSVVLLRQLAQKDDVVMTAFLGNAFPALYLVVPALLLGVAPAPADLPAFAFTGLAGFGLWFMLTQAYARAPAQRLAAAEYTALIWSAALGYFFFAEVPRWQVWIGALVIVVAVGLTAWDSRKRTEPASQPAQAD
ncbi:MAG: DMT family transporter [Hyphomonadaceae bacterium]|nr:DMT family transporter [Hyphomonadaceae bacterium]